VHFPQIVTLDTMSAPKPGERRHDGVLPPIDLGALREKLSAVEEETKANDPKALRAEITQLRRELASKSAGPTNAELQEAQADGVQQGIAEARQMFEQRFKNVSFELVKLADVLLVPLPIEARVSAPVRQPQPVHPTPPAPVPTTRPAESSTALGKGDRLVLTVLAQYQPARVSASKAAAIAGYSVKSSTWRNILSRLRQAALIEQGPEPFAITPNGIMVLGPFDPLPTGAALLEHWMARIGKGDRETLRILATLHGECPSSDLAQRAGYNPSSSTWRNILSRLRTLGLIEGSRNIKLHEDLR